MKEENVGEGITVVSFDNDEEMFAYMDENRRQMIASNQNLSEAQEAIKPGDFYTWQNAVTGEVGYGYYYTLKENIYAEAYHAEAEELLETGIDYIIEHWNHAQLTGMVHTVYFDKFGYELGSMHRSYFVEKTTPEEFYAKMKEYGHEGLTRWMITVTEKEPVL